MYIHIHTYIHTYIYIYIIYILHIETPKDRHPKQELAELYAMRAQAKVALGDLAPWKNTAFRRPGSGPAGQNGMVYPPKI
jgi:hypothetical protein